MSIVRAPSLRLEDLSPDLFRQFAKLVFDLCGVDLSSDKRALLHNRLVERIATLGLRSYYDYYRVLVEDSSAGELQLLVDRVTTHSTHFFREQKQLDHFASVIPELVENRGGLHVWSAACSTGEEAYTLAMTMLDNGVAGGAVLASDVSSSVLSIAKDAEYGERPFHSVPPSFKRSRYFDEIQTRDGERCWRVKPAIRQLVSFRRVNLTQSRFQMTETFDVIYCRNVLIYFRRETQSMVIDRLVGRLRLGGYLYTGLSESLVWLDDPRLEKVDTSVYRRVS